MHELLHIWSTKWRCSDLSYNNISDTVPMNTLMKATFLAVPLPAHAQKISQTLFDESWRKGRGSWDRYGVTTHIFFSDRFMFSCEFSYFMNQSFRYQYYHAQILTSNNCSGRKTEIQLVRLYNRGKGRKGGSRELHTAVDTVQNCISSRPPNEVTFVRTVTHGT